MSTVADFATSTPSDVSQSLVYINPRSASRILESNTRNRPLSEASVNSLLREMLSGRWQYNGESIKLSVDGALLDGQHRLTALARVPIDDFELPFLVVSGLAAATQNTMDQGRTRTAADQMSIDGLASTDSKIVAGAIRIYLEWHNGILFADRVSNRVGNTEVVSWAHDHAVELAIMREVCNQKLRRVKCRPSLTCAVLTHFRMLDGQAALDFEEGLLTGAGLQAGNPILTLRDRLDRIKTQGLRMSDRDLIAFFIIAWNAWREGRSMVKFQRPHGGVWDRTNFPVAV